MIYSRRYSRNFIPLKQDSQKHNLDFRPSLGRCVVEIKDGRGKVNIYAQGINPKSDYYLEFIGFEKGNIKNVCLGKFNVDSYGKGEFSVQFDPDNMENTKSKIEDFNVVSIMVKDDTDISSALVGYVGNEIDWKEQYKANAVINVGKGNSCEERPQEDNNSNRPNNNNNNSNNSNNNNGNMPNNNNNNNSNNSNNNNSNRPNNNNNNNNNSPNNNNISDIEQGLIDKEEGLLEREQGLIDREKGLVEREESQTKIPLDEYERWLKEKLDGLAEKEKGLAEKEQGLLEKERALKQGFLPPDDEEIRAKELALIKREIELIKIEQELINRERMLIRKNPTSDRERGLIEKEKGILEREQGLLDREKGLIEKEKGLLEIEKGMREKNKYTKKQVDVRETNTNHQNFKDMLDNLRRNMMNIQDIDAENKTIDNDIDYIKSKNVKMSPFVNKQDNIDWYRISPYDLTSLSDNSWKYSNNPFVFTSYKKYKHLMLGVNKQQDKETYILAIPCRYENKFSLKDFKQFLPVDNNISTTSINNGEYGYRIVEL
ncbi:MAG: hypothetical protein KIC92_02640 [Clostridiales bacterium]|nr:hypothetical protein [Clostridiales bacterium]